MLQTMGQLLQEGSEERILLALETALERSDESPFWAEKVLPLSHALLSVLIPLRDQGLLFTPEGEPASVLTPELLLRWCDLVSMKHLAFTLQKSNDSRCLERTRYDTERTAAYTPVALERFGNYLGGYGVDLANEYNDFPIAHYNLHIGIASVLKSLLES